MAVVIQDPNGQTLRELRLDTPDQTQYKVIIVRNTGSAQADNIKVRLMEAGYGSADASYLSQRTTIQMDYTRLSSGMAEQQFLGVSPISVLTEDEEELEGIHLDGWLQLSADTFRWASLLIAGPLLSNEFLKVYARYAKPATEAEPIYTFRFTLRNIGDDALQSVVLIHQGTDTLSLNGTDFTDSVSLGDMAPTAIRTIWVKTSVIKAKPIPVDIEVLCHQWLSCKSGQARVKMHFDPRTSV